MVAAKSRYITGLVEIKQAYAKMSPGSKKSLREYVQFNSELETDTGPKVKRGKRWVSPGRTQMAKAVVMVWSLCAITYLGASGRRLLGAWNLGERPHWMSASSWQASLEGPSGPAVSRQGITTNQMRALVGLSPIKGALEKTVSSKSNPKGLRSRSAGR